MKTKLTFETGCCHLYPVRITKYEEYDAVNMREMVFASQHVKKVKNLEHRYLCFRATINKSVRQRVVQRVEDCCKKHIANRRSKIKIT